MAASEASAIWAQKSRDLQGPPLSNGPSDGFASVLDTPPVHKKVPYLELQKKKFVNAMLALYYRESSLARINFIKSRLVYESFSDLSKDVDLVSQEILLLDTRFAHCPANKETQLLTLSFHLVSVEIRIPMRIRIQGVKPMGGSGSES
jgi:hypothetical protein